MSEQVLYMEDDEAQARLARKCLERAGYEVGRGTGQGLAIVHNIVVDKYGGRIDLETKEGAGTKFILRLPIDGPLQPHAAALHAEELAV